MPRIHAKEPEEEPDEQQDHEEDQDGRDERHDRPENASAGGDDLHQEVNDQKAHEERDVQSAHRWNDPTYGGEVPLGGNDNDSTDLAIPHVGNPRQKGPSEQDHQEDG